MKLFQRIVQQRPVANGFQQKASTDTQTSFLLEPILTPSAGIDGTEGTPEMAIAQLSPPALADFDLPGIDAQLDASDSFLDNEVYDLSDGDLEPIPFIDSLGAVDPSTPGGFESGVFTVGSSGDVGIDFLFDGGAYQGELAVFSLEGMEQFEPGSEAFIQEAARRALSSSDLGHVVISDATDAARFSGSFAWEGDFNSGDYQGMQIFQMSSGDRLGFMLVPNGSVQAVLENPCDGGLRLLFSMSTANPNDSFQAGQIADLTGDGNTFVFEDLRVDSHSDRDYNDMVFQVRGATANTAQLDDVLDPNRDWLTSDMGQVLTHYTEPYLQPETNTGDPSSTLVLPPVEQWPIFDPSDPDGYEFPLENQTFVGIVDTGITDSNPHLDYSHITPGYDWVDHDANPFLTTGEGSEHGTHIAGIIQQTNDDAPLWVGRAVGSGQWANSLREFVDTALHSEQPNAVVNLSFDLSQVAPDGSIVTRHEFTPEEWAALEYAQANNVLVVAAAGNENSTISALGQASLHFDNIITVGSAYDANSQVSVANGFSRAAYSSYDTGLTLLAEGGTPQSPILSTVSNGVGTMAGTSVAAAKVTGAVSQIWAANPDLSYQQVVNILKSTATDLRLPNWDLETGAGLLNLAAAIHLAKSTTPVALPTIVAVPPTQWSDGTNSSERMAGVFSELPGGGITSIDLGELQRLNQIKPIITAVASQFGILPAIVAGIISRETNTRNIIGDSGRGHGYMQLDIGTFPNITNEPWDDPTWNITEGVKLLINDKYNYIKTRLPEPLHLRGSIAAYNSGQGNVVSAYNQGLDVDTYTTSQNYSTDVLNRARWLLANGWGDSSISPIPPEFTGRILNAGYVQQVGFLRIRSGPGTNYAEVGRHYPGTELAFTEETQGSWVPDPAMPGGGSDKWYRLADGSGWMSALYVEKVNTNPVDGGFPYPIVLESFGGTVAPIGEPWYGVAYRITPHFDDTWGEGIAAPSNTPLEFDAWTYGEVGLDFWFGNEDALWFRIKGTDYWVPSVFIAGYPGSQPPLLPPQTLPPSEPGEPTPGIGDPGSSTLSLPVDWNLPAYQENNPLWRAGYAPSSVNPPNPQLGNSKGNCTWYVNGRLRQLGYSSSDLNQLIGMAYNWDNQARSAGIPISTVPQVGSIAQWENGHVAVVEQVNPDGSIVISESSYDNPGGQYDYLYSTRTISATNPTRYINVRR